MALLTGSANCVRYVLFAFNFVFVITGIILISVGVTVAAAYGKYDAFLEDKFYSIPTLLIVIGSFIFFIAFFGCCGAIKENYCMILTFSILLGLIFVLELAGGISGYVLRDETANLIDDRLNKTMKNYNKPGYQDVTFLWDYVQREFYCCGVKGYQDWSSVYNEGAYVPLSCCKIPNGVTSFNCTTEVENHDLYRVGCLSLFAEHIKAHAVSLGAAGVILAIIQFAGIFFACYISREIKIRNGGTGFF